MRAKLESNNFKILVQEFRNWLKTKEMSQSCITNYPVALAEYFEYLEMVHNIKHINKVEKKHSTMFKAYLQIRSNKVTGRGGIHNQSINGTLKGLNNFNKFIAQCSTIYKYGIQEDYLKVEHAEKIVLDESEVQELMDATYEAYPHAHAQQAFGQRDRVILHLLYSCGLRLNEARWLNISDLDFANTRILVRNGKGNKQRYVACTGYILDEIRAYIECGRYFFTHRHHNKLCKKRVYKKEQTPEDQQALLIGITATRLMSFTPRLNYLKSKTTISKHLTNHILRHSYGTHMYRRGMKLERIQRLLGHESVDTTMIYVHLAKQLDDELNNDYNEAV